jgi:hypothetical protein
LAILNTGKDGTYDETTETQTREHVTEHLDCLMMMMMIIIIIIMRKGI